MLWSQHQRDTSACCGAAGAFADPTRCFLRGSGARFIYFFCSAQPPSPSTVHTAARSLPLEVVPWRRTQTEAQQTAGKDRPTNKGTHCRWTKGRLRPLRLMQSMETCTGCFFVEGEAMSFFYTAGCVLSRCAASCAAGLF